MIDRNERQNQQVEKWANDYNARSYLVAATGYGKTHVAIKAIQKCNQRDSNRVIHVVVPTTTLKNAWVKKKTGHVDKHKLKNVEVFVVNTYVKLPRKCDLLIADEAHRYTSEDAHYFPKVIGETVYNWILCLSATLEPRHVQYLETRGIRKVDEVTLEECKANGWVSEFTVVNFGVELDEEDRAKYDKMHKSFNQYFAYFSHDFDLAMNCLKSRDVREARARETEIPVDKLYVMAVQWNRNMRERKSFLYHAHAKMVVAKEIAKIQDRHIICFSESVDFTQRLSEEIGETAVSFHSKNGIKANREALRKFTDRRTRVNCMCTAKAMDEGFDAPDADMGIICSRTSKKLQNIQRIGRLIRAQEGKKAIVINLYVKNSQDEIWLRKASRGMKCLWIDDLDILKRLVESS